MNNLNDFETISTIDFILDDELNLQQGQERGLAVPCACFIEDDNSDSEL